MQLHKHSVKDITAFCKHNTVIFSFFPISSFSLCFSVLRLILLECPSLDYIMSFPLQGFGSLRKYLSSMPLLSVFVLSSFLSTRHHKSFFFSPIAACFPPPPVCFPLTFLNLFQNSCNTFRWPVFPCICSLDPTGVSFLNLLKIEPGIHSFNYSTHAYRTLTMSYTLYQALEIQQQMRAWSLTS